jgi:hypothetical protein
MGYQLLTFSSTGTRRRGTRAEELRLLFETRLTVNSIFEPLQCCCDDDSARDVIEELKRLDFDVVGVLERKSSRVIGWLDRSHVADGPCRRWMQAIEPDHVVSDSTSLSAVLRVLGGQPWAFVVAGHGVAGIVTRSDLQKPPVRAVIFGLLSLLEIHLTYWIGQHFQSDQWQELLSEKRVSAANTLLSERANRNEEISLLDCLQLCDKRDILFRCPALIDIFGLESPKAARQILRGAEGLRNRVAHSQDLVTGWSWQELSETVNSVEKILSLSDLVIGSRSQDGPPSKLRGTF